MPERVPAETLRRTRASFDRSQKDGFYEAFYTRLLASDPTIPPMFAHTDFIRQHKVLKHALGLLLVYGEPGNGKILDRLASRHGRGDLNIQPRLYPLFANALVATIRDFDPEFTPEVEADWRRSIAPGLEFLASFYTAQG